MITSETINSAMYEKGRSDALKLQERSSNMTGTELYAESNSIPTFVESCKIMNMLDRSIGFVCKSSAGRVVKLLQPYDSSIYTQEPEDLPAQWGFKWSTNPKDALPFIAISTSTYGLNECCVGVDGNVYKSLIDGNIWPPEEYPSGWELV